MTDFLTRAAARAVGVTERVRPVGPARFDPAMPVEEENTEESATSTREHGPDRSMGKEVAPPHHRVEAEHNGEVVPSEVAMAPPTTTSTEGPPPLLPDRTVVPIAVENGPGEEPEPAVAAKAQPAIEAVPQSRGGELPGIADVDPITPAADARPNRSDAAREAERVVVPRPASIETDRTITATAILPVVTPEIEKPAHDGRPTETVDRSQPPARETAAPPAIRVTIGTIEVRASRPAAPQPIRRAARHEPVLSLEDYAERRRGGS